MRDEQYALAARHRLGLLPYDDARGTACVACASRNTDTPTLLVDPDHMHSCLLQQGVSVTRRHDALKQVLAELARTCGYHVEVEPHFPATVTHSAHPHTGQPTRAVHQSNARGDLLLVRHNTRVLLDVTVVRPTQLSHLQRAGDDGPHMQPLYSAALAEQGKHQSYDAECARHGYKMVPVALETYGAMGKEGGQLLARMAAHSLDRSPKQFLAHAARVLSVALQAGNAGVAAQGTAELHLQAYKRGSGERPDSGAGGRAVPGSRQHTRAHRQHAQLQQQMHVRGDMQGSIARCVHAGYHSARVGVRSQSGSGSSVVSGAGAG